MYSLDINFLNDREERQVEFKPQAARVDRGDQRPLFIGLAVAIATLAGLGGYWLILQSQIKELRAEEMRLAGELSELQSKLQAVANVQAQIDLIQAEIGAFVSVFNQIRPWSALLQDLRDTVPTRIQVETLTQIEGVVAEGQPEGALSAGGIEIRGQACAFDDVNDFLLVLQRSPLLEGETVQLVDARLQDEVLDPSEDGGCPGAPSNDPFNLVDYTVRSNITSKSASELLGTLESEGAVGLVSRLRVLEDTGVIQP